MNVGRDQLLAALKQAEALVVQLRTLLGTGGEVEEPRCPRCSGKDLADAGDGLYVCAGCNANIQDGEVIDG